MVKSIVLYYEDGTRVSVEGVESTVMDIVTKLEGKYTAVRIDEVLGKDGWNLNELKRLLEKDN